MSPGFQKEHMSEKVIADVHGRAITIETGKFAKQADGAVTVQLGETIVIVAAVAAGEGPDRALLALGYAGWDGGQLEDEIQHNGWLHCPANPSLLFDRDLGGKYTRALRSMGVDLGRLSANAGHA